MEGFLSLPGWENYSSSISSLCYAYLFYADLEAITYMQRDLTHQETHIRWGVGNGSRVRFWSDVWIEEHALREVVVESILEAEGELLIQDFIRDDGPCNWEIFDLLATNEQRWKRHQTDNMGCEATIEDGLHILQDCTGLRKTWCRIIRRLSFLVLSYGI